MGSPYAKNVSRTEADDLLFYSELSEVAGRLDFSDGALSEDDPAVSSASIDSDISVVELTLGSSSDMRRGGKRVAPLSQGLPTLDSPVKPSPAKRHKCSHIHDRSVRDAENRSGFQVLWRRTDSWVQSGRKSLPSRELIATPRMQPRKKAHELWLDRGWKILSYTEYEGWEHRTTFSEFEAKTVAAQRVEFVIVPPEPSEKPMFFEHHPDTYYPKTRPGEKTIPDAPEKKRPSRSRLAEQKGGDRERRSPFSPLQQGQVRSPARNGMTGLFTEVVSEIDVGQQRRASSADQSAENRSPVGTGARGRSAGLFGSPVLDLNEVAGVAKNFRRTQLFGFR